MQHEPQLDNSRDNQHKKQILLSLKGALYSQHKLASMNDSA